MNDNKVTFKWSNYTKPTPRNLKMFMEFWRGMIVFITANNFYNGVKPWIGISIAILGYVIDRLAKFFAQAEEDMAKTSVIVEFPTKISDQVSVTTEIKEPEEKKE